jgi:hypothetical protein
MSTDLEFDETLGLVRESLDNIETTANLIEQVLDHLLHNEFTSLTSEKLDELIAKLQTALIILCRKENSVTTLIPTQTYTKTWITNIHTLMNFLHKLPVNGPVLF